MIRPHGIGLYAPAGFAVDPTVVDRAETRLVAMWERVVVDPTCRTRWQRFAASDDEALAAFSALAREEGIIGAFESCHALAHALRMAEEAEGDEPVLLVNLSGRGDKDLGQAMTLVAPARSAAA